MKKLIISAAFIFAAFTGVFAKANNDENKNVINAFNRMYPHASTVEWKKVNDELSIATFNMNGSTMKAVYNADAALVATSKPVTLKEVPAKALETINKKYNNYTIREAIEFNDLANDAETCYYISVENDNKKIILKCSTKGTVEEFKTSYK